MRSNLFCAAALAVAFAGPAEAADVRAKVENRSYATKCAEFDNVYLTLTNPAVRRFEIDVSAPVYLDDLKADDTAPNFADCEAMKDDPKFKFTPKQLTLFDDGQTRVIGHTYAESWRPKGAEVAVGEVTAADIHLVQLFEKIGDKFVEYLVVYPFDGYWRAKPIPPERFPDAAYGTSFLVGPIEEQHRPIVDMTRLEIDAKARTFRMAFAKGGSGELKVLKADRNQILLDVTFDDGVPKGDAAPPFAAIRSMFVSPTNADTARAVWRMDGGLFIEPVMEFRGASTSEIRFDRVELSKHNTSAPDVTLRGFQDVQN